MFKCAHMISWNYRFNSSSESTYNVLSLENQLRTIEKFNDYYHSQNSFRKANIITFAILISIVTALYLLSGLLYIVSMNRIGNFVKNIGTVMAIITAMTLIICTFIYYFTIATKIQNNAKLIEHTIPMEIQVPALSSASQQTLNQLLISLQSNMSSEIFSIQEKTQLIANLSLSSLQSNPALGTSIIMNNNSNNAKLVSNTNTLTTNSVSTSNVITITNIIHTMQNFCDQIGVTLNNHIDLNTVTVDLVNPTFYTQITNLFSEFNFILQQLKNILPNNNLSLVNQIQNTLDMMKFSKNISGKNSAIDAINDMINNIQNVLLITQTVQDGSIQNKEALLRKINQLLIDDQNLTDLANQIEKLETNYNLSKFFNEIQQNSKQLTDYSSLIQLLNTLNQSLNNKLSVMNQFTQSIGGNSNNLIQKINSILTNLKTQNINSLQDWNNLILNYQNNLDANSNLNTILSLLKINNFTQLSDLLSDLQNTLKSSNISSSNHSLSDMQDILRKIDNTSNDLKNLLEKIGVNNFGDAMLSLHSSELVIQNYTNLQDMIKQQKDQLVLFNTPIVIAGLNLDQIRNLIQVISNYKINISLSQYINNTNQQINNISQNLQQIQQLLGAQDYDECLKICAQFKNIMVKNNWISIDDALQSSIQLTNNIKLTQQDIKNLKFQDPNMILDQFQLSYVSQCLIDINNLVNSANFNYDTMLSEYQLTIEVLQNTNLINVTQNILSIEKQLRHMGYTDNSLVSHFLINMINQTQKQNICMTKMFAVLGTSEIDPLISKLNIIADKLNMSKYSGQNSIQNIVNNLTQQDQNNNAMITSLQNQLSVLNMDAQSFHNQLKILQKNLQSLNLTGLTMDNCVQNIKTFYIQNFNQVLGIINSVNNMFALTNLQSFSDIKSFYDNQFVEVTKRLANVVSNYQAFGLINGITKYQQDYTNFHNIKTSFYNLKAALNSPNLSTDQLVSNLQSMTSLLQNGLDSLENIQIQKNNNKDLINEILSAANSIFNTKDLSTLVNNMQNIMMQNNNSLNLLNKLQQTNAFLNINDFAQIYTRIQNSDFKDMSILASLILRAKQVNVSIVNAKMTQAINFIQNLNQLYTSPMNMTFDSIQQTLDMLNTYNIGNSIVMLQEYNPATKAFEQYTYNFAQPIVQKIFLTQYRITQLQKFINSINQQSSNTITDPLMQQLLNDNQKIITQSVNAMTNYDQNFNIQTLFDSINVLVQLNLANQIIQLYNKNQYSIAELIKTIYYT